MVIYGRQKLPIRFLMPETHVFAWTSPLLEWFYVLCFCVCRVDLRCLLLSMTPLLYHKRFQKSRVFVKFVYRILLKFLYKIDGKNAPEPVEKSCIK